MQKVSVLLRKSCCLTAAATMAVGFLFAGAMVLLPMPAVAQTMEEGHAHDLSDIWDIGRGGQLYDNWAAVLEHDPPSQTHPAYPKDGKKKGATTWRCKECHGWDYKGVDGA